MRDSITNVRSSGLGGAVHEIKRHSKVKVPKVSHGVRKLKNKYSKTVRAESKKRVSQTVHRRKVSARTKETMKKYDKYGDRIK
jgi:hypothetical protein